MKSLHWMHASVISFRNIIAEHRNIHCMLHNFGNSSCVGIMPDDMRPSPSLLSDWVLRSKVSPVHCVSSFSRRNRIVSVFKKRCWSMHIAWLMFSAAKHARRAKSKLQDNFLDPCIAVARIRAAGARARTHAHTHTQTQRERERDVLSQIKMYVKLKK